MSIREPKQEGAESKVGPGSGSVDDFEGDEEGEEPPAKKFSQSTGRRAEGARSLVEERWKKYEPVL